MCKYLASRIFTVLISHNDYSSLSRGYKLYEINFTHVDLICSRLYNGIQTKAISVIKINVGLGFSEMILQRKRELKIVL